MKRPTVVRCGNEQCCFKLQKRVRCRDKAMRTNLLTFVLVAAVFSSVPGGQAKEVSLPQSEISRLALIVALLDYPIEQIQVYSLLGLPKEIQPAWGSNLGLASEQRGAVWYWPLSELEDGAVFCLRAFYSPDTMETTGRIPLITAMEVVYRDTNGRFLPMGPRSFPPRLIPHLKLMMKESSLSPRAVTEPANLRKCYEAIAADIQKDREARMRH